MGRWLSVLLLLQLVASAQGALVLEDPVGDVSIQPVGPTPTAGGWEPADLVALDITESATYLRFQVTFVPKSAPDLRTLTDAVDWNIHFNVGAIAYRILVADSPIFGSDDYVSGYLYSKDKPGARDRLVTTLPALLEPTQGRVFVDVFRGDLRNELGVEVTAAEDLTNVHATSDGGWITVSSGLGLWPRPYDRMPDVGEEVFDIRLGALQTGHIRLATADRLRASNGAATTYFFDINVSNSADYGDRLALSLVGTPEPWQVRLPYTELDVPANSSVRMPLLATVPFAHSHGAIETFTVEARSTRDAEAVGRVELGVEYLEIAQPAGHHSRSYLHGSGGAGAVIDSMPFIVFGDTRGSTWFNTLEEDPRGPTETMYGRWGQSGSLLQQRHGWVMPLDPTLRLGLDFDMSSVGEFVGRVGSEIDLDNAVLHGKILAVGRGNVTANPDDYRSLAGARVLAEVDPETIGTITAGNSVGFSTTITPMPDGDLFPPTRDDNMVMVVWLEGTGVPSVVGLNDRAWLERGASIDLPLFEYHDPIDEAFSAPDFIHIDAQGPVERFVAPGGTVLYELRLRNDGARDGTFDVTAYGSNADWVDFPAGKRFQVPATGQAIIPISVAAPALTPTGESADVVVEAVAREDERMRGLIRLAAVVDGERAVENDVDDTEQVEAIIAQAKKESPGVGVGFLAPVLVGGALALRRRP